MEIGSEWCPDQWGISSPGVGGFPSTGLGVIAIEAAAVSMACVCQWIEGCMFGKGGCQRDGVLQTGGLRSLAERFCELPFELCSSLMTFHLHSRLLVSKIMTAWLPGWLWK